MVNQIITLTVAADIPTSERKPKIIIRKSEAVAAQTGLSLSAISRLVAEGSFPNPISLTGRERGWLNTDIDNWIASKVKARELSEE
jgi:prophage regulatory protein